MISLPWVFSDKQLEEHNKQIRADAIEECITEIRQEFAECGYVADWLEQLKENKL